MSRNKLLSAKKPGRLQKEQDSLNGASVGWKPVENEFELCYNHALLKSKKWLKVQLMKKENR